MVTGIRHNAVLVPGFVLVALVLAACGDGPESTLAPAVVSTPAPTPDIEATVEARVAEERANVNVPVMTST